MSEMVKEMSGGACSVRGAGLRAAFRRAEAAGPFAANCRYDARAGHGRRPAEDLPAWEDTRAMDILMGGKSCE